MKYLNILFVLLIMLSCRNSGKERKMVKVDFDNNPVDSVNSDVFFKKNKLEYFLLGLDTLHSKHIGWAQDPCDLYLEGVYIDNKLLKIYQPYKIDTISHPEKTKNRLYIYNGKRIRTTRIIIDSLKFYFDDVFFQLDSPEIYRKDSFIIWMDQPAGWCGLANQYEFIAIFDLKRLRCYETLINLYSICPPDVPKLRVSTDKKKRN